MPEVQASLRDSQSYRTRHNFYNHINRFIVGIRVWSATSRTTLPFSNSAVKNGGNSLSRGVVGFLGDPRVLTDSDGKTESALIADEVHAWDGNSGGRRRHYIHSCSQLGLASGCQTRVNFPPHRASNRDARKSNLMGKQRYRSWMRRIDFPAVAFNVPMRQQCVPFHSEFRKGRPFYCSSPSPRWTRCSSSKLITSLQVSLASDPSRKSKNPCDRHPSRRVPHALWLWKFASP